MKGRVAVLRQFHQPIEIEEYEVPAIEPGAILVKTTMAGVCGSDLHTWRGDQGARAMPPSGSAFGHEGTGVVYSLGVGVKTDSEGKPLKEGDRIVYNAQVSCHRCRQCLSGKHNLCAEAALTYRRAPIGQFPFFIGTFGDFVYLPPNHPVFQAPDELSDEILAPLNCAMGTIMHGLRRAGLRAGQSIAFQGVGGLGLTGVALAKDAGAGPIIAIDGLANRLQLARDLGATHAVDLNEYPTPDERTERVREITGGEGADIVVELVGFGSLLSEGVAMLAPEGTFLEIGNIIGSPATFVPSALLRGKRIVGSAMYPPSLLPDLLKFLLHTPGRSAIERQVSHRFPLAEINQAFNQSEWQGKQTDVIRSVIVP